MGPSTDRVTHQAICVTDDPAGVRAALASMLGDPEFVSILLGPGSAVEVEVVPLPAQLRGRLMPATTPISFAVDHLDERVAACRAAGLDVAAGIGAGDLPFAVVTVAGLEFELVRCPTG